MATRALLFASGLGLVIGCSAPATSTTTSTTPPPIAEPTQGPPANDGTFTADGKYFASERVYEGNCAPAGSRGGCYRLTLRPDGTMEYFMLDAGVGGTYVIEGEAVTITPRDGQSQKLALSADRTMVGELKLKTP